MSDEGEYSSVEEDGYSGSDFEGEEQSDEISGAPIPETDQSISHDEFDKASHEASTLHQRHDDFELSNTSKKSSYIYDFEEEEEEEEEEDDDDENKEGQEVFVEMVEEDGEGGEVNRDTRHHEPSDEPSDLSFTERQRLHQEQERGVEGPEAEGRDQQLG